jgi:hypothetical protein
MYNIYETRQLYLRTMLQKQLVYSATVSKTLRSEGAEK